MIKYKGLHLYIDLAAKRIIDDKEVAIEVKVFGDLSFVNEFEKAIGQYDLYRDMLKRIFFDGEIYLAISEEGLDEFLSRPPIVEYVKDSQILLMVFNEDKEEVVQWIK